MKTIVGFSKNISNKNMLSSILTNSNDIKYSLSQIFYSWVLTFFGKEWTSLQTELQRRTNSGNVETFRQDLYLYEWGRYGLLIWIYVFMLELVYVR